MSVYKQPAKTEAKWRPPMTCADCLHVDFAADQCGRWKAKPPLKVSCNAEKACQDFDLAIPF